jgi:nucleotide-binding universal stress UspA family protein
MVMDEGKLAAGSARFQSVACWVDTAKPDVARALVQEARRWVTPGRDSRLVVAHVDAWLPPLRSRHSVWNLDRPEFFDQVREYLAQLCEEVPGAEPLLLSSLDPPLEAANWAREEGIDLVVVAAHNSPLSPARMGSFAGPLTALSEVPVIVVSSPSLAAGADAAGRAGVAHIACCVDESRTSEAALDMAADLARETGARLTAVHGVVHARALRMLGLSRVVPSPRSRERPVIARLAEQANQVPGAEFCVVDGRPQDVCVWAAQHDVDLIVAGASHRSTGVRLPGSFAREVAVHATCPVMLVPAKTTGGPAAGS